MPHAEAQPDVVYHYTSMDTLLKIVGTSSVWATNIRYLNDVSEREHFLSLIRKRIRSILPHSPLDASLFDRVLDEDEENTPFHDLPSVASFSRERGSLPQWRSYSPQGNGVCIGFATESLCKAYIGEPSTAKTGPLANAQFTFEPVQYLAKDDNNAADELLQKAMAEVDEQEIIIKAEDYPA
jgi:hypothetical protein